MEDARYSDIQTKEGVRFSYISQLEDVQAAVHDISTQAAIAVDCEGKLSVTFCANRLLTGRRCFFEPNWAPDLAASRYSRLSRVFI